MRLKICVNSLRLRKKIAMNGATTFPVFHSTKSTLYNATKRHFCAQKRETSFECVPIRNNSYLAGATDTHTHNCPLSKIPTRERAKLLACFLLCGVHQQQ